VSRVGHTALLGVVLSACVGSAGYRDLAHDEIDVRDVVLPAGARAGMFITWSVDERDPDDESLVEETIACVERTAQRVTIEWRTTWHGGRSSVVAARFAPDGTVLGAWRGPPGREAVRLRLMELEFDADEAKDEADRAGKTIGVSTDDVDIDQETVVEDVETPAGTFRCVRRTIKAQLLFVKMRDDMWFAAEGALPLSRVVKTKSTAPMGYRVDRVVTKYGTSGARPTLTLPKG